MTYLVLGGYGRYFVHCFVFMGNAFLSDASCTYYDESSKNIHYVIIYFINKRCVTYTVYKAKTIIVLNYLITKLWRRTGERRKVPRFLDLGTIWGWEVSFASWPLYPREKSSRYPLDRKLGGSQNLSELCGENSWPYRNSNCDHFTVESVTSSYTNCAKPSSPLSYKTHASSDFRTHTGSTIRTVKTPTAKATRGVSYNKNVTISTARRSRSQLIIPANGLQLPAKMSRNSWAGKAADGQRRCGVGDMTPASEPTDQLPLREELPLAHTHTFMWCGANSVRTEQHLRTVTICSPGGVCVFMEQ
jgi:hypothetical protein